VRAIDVFFTLETISLTRNIMIKHKEAIVICEKSGPVIINYNVIITQLDSKPVIHPIVTYTTTR